MNTSIYINGDKKNGYRTVEELNKYGIINIDSCVAAIWDTARKNFIEYEKKEKEAKQKVKEEKKKKRNENNKRTLDDPSLTGLEPPNKKAKTNLSGGEQFSLCVGVINK